jgi:hypothetical protein
MGKGISPEETILDVMVPVDCRKNKASLAWDIASNQSWDAYELKDKRLPSPVIFEHPPSPEPVTFPLKPVTKPRQQVVRKQAVLGKAPTQRQQVPQGQTVFQKAPTERHNY